LLPLPTIDIREGQFANYIEATEAAVIASGQPVYARAGFLCRPVREWEHFKPDDAGDDSMIMTAKLADFEPDSFFELVARSAISRRYSDAKKSMVETAPPSQLVRSLLKRSQCWRYPRVSGVVTVPILRSDGRLLDKPGYDLRSELYLESGI